MQFTASGGTLDILLDGTTNITGEVFDLAISDGMGIPQTFAVSQPVSPLCMCVWGGGGGARVRVCVYVYVYVSVRERLCARVCTFTLSLKMYMCVFVGAGWLI